MVGRIPEAGFVIARIGRSGGTARRVAGDFLFGDDVAQQGHGMPGLGVTRPSMKAFAFTRRLGYDRNSYCSSWTSRRPSGLSAPVVEAYLREEELAPQGIATMRA
jgi:hypothetical protein